MNKTLFYISAYTSLMGAILTCILLLFLGFLGVAELLKSFQWRQSAVVPILIGLITLIAALFQITSLRFFVQGLSMSRWQRFKALFTVIVAIAWLIGLIVLVFVLPNRDLLFFWEIMVGICIGCVACVGTYISYRKAMQNH